MKNGPVARGLYLCVFSVNLPLSTCRLNSFVFQLTVFIFHLRLSPHLQLPGLRLLEGPQSLRRDGKQSKANCCTASACCTQVEWEVRRALTRHWLAVSEQRPADGCEAELKPADSRVPVHVPETEIGGWRRVHGLRRPTCAAQHLVTGIDWITSHQVINIVTTWLLPSQLGTGRIPQDLLKIQRENLSAGTLSAAKTSGVVS